MPCRISSSAGHGISLQQLFRSHDHAGRAEPALQAMLIPEGFLHRMQLAVLREPFNGQHVAPVRLDRKHACTI